MIMEWNFLTWMCLALEKRRVVVKLTTYGQTIYYPVFLSGSSHIQFDRSSNAALKVDFIYLFMTSESNTNVNRSI